MRCAKTLTRQLANWKGLGSLGHEPPAEALTKPSRPASTGKAAKVLRSLGITLDAARAEVERALGRGPEGVGAEEAVELPLTPLAARALEAAEEEAKALGE